MKKYRIFFKETFLGRTLIWAATYLVVLFQVLPALALPQGETVVNGDVTFERNGNRMTVNQGTDRAIVNYNGFDIDSGEGVRFAQPDARAAILNRVTGPGSSAIAGELSANGRVFLINPNGILFTPSAQVDVGALVASALNLSDSDFMAGNLRFSGGGGPVVNEGTLNGGFVYLIGGTVENRGTIHADDVVLAAGQSVLIDKAVDGEIRVTIDEDIASSNQSADVSIVNEGAVTASNVTISAAGEITITNSVVADNRIQITSTAGIIDIASATNIAVDNSGNITLTAATGEVNLSNGSVSGGQVTIMPSVSIGATGSVQTIVSASDSSNTIADIILPWTNSVPIIVSPLDSTKPVVDRVSPIFGSVPQSVDTPEPVNMDPVEKITEAIAVANVEVAPSSGKSVRTGSGIGQELTDIEGKILMPVMTPKSAKPIIKLEDFTRKENIELNDAINMSAQVQF